MEKIIRFQIAKGQPQGNASLLLIFFSDFSLVLLIKKACNLQQNLLKVKKPKSQQRKSKSLFQINSTNDTQKEFSLVPNCRGTEQNSL